MQYFIKSILFLAGVFLSLISLACTNKNEDIESTQRPLPPPPPTVSPTPATPEGNIFTDALNQQSFWLSENNSYILKEYNAKTFQPIKNIDLSGLFPNMSGGISAINFLAPNKIIAYVVPSNANESFVLIDTTTSKFRIIYQSDQYSGQKVNFIATYKSSLPPRYTSKVITPHTLGFDLFTVPDNIYTPNSKDELLRDINIFGNLQKIKDNTKCPEGIIKSLVLYSNGVIVLSSFIDATKKGGLHVIEVPFEQGNQDPTCKESYNYADDELKITNSQDEPEIAAVINQQLFVVYYNNQEKYNKIVQYQIDTTAKLVNPQLVRSKGLPFRITALTPYVKGTFLVAGKHLEKNEGILSIIQQDGKILRTLTQYPPNISALAFSSETQTLPSPTPTPLVIMMH